jgi:hypothetical protein
VPLPYFKPRRGFTRGEHLLFTRGLKYWVWPH